MNMWIPRKSMLIQFDTLNHCIAIWINQLNEKIIFIFLLNLFIIYTNSIINDIWDRNLPCPWKKRSAVVRPFLNKPYIVVDRSCVKFGCAKGLFFAPRFYPSPFQNKKVHSLLYCREFLVSYEVWSRLTFRYLSNM